MNLARFTKTNLLKSMNERLRKLERKMFIELYGEDEADLIDKMSNESKNKSKNMEYTERPPSLRAEIDKRNNEK